MKKILVLAFVLFFAFSAAAFTVDMETVRSSADQSSPAQFEVAIENTDGQNHTYSVSILSPKSSWLYYPDTVRVPAYSNKTFNITASPVENALQQRYRFDGKVREQASGEINEFSGIFNVQQPYKLHIIDLKQDKQILMPGEVVSTEIEVKNLDSSALENYEIQAEYRNQSKTDSGTSILPGGTRRYEFNFKTSKNASPGTHQINYTVMAEGQLQNTAQQTVTIQSVENISRSENTENRILVFRKTVAATNIGNSPSNISLTTENPSYLESITSPIPETAEVRSVAGETVYTWNTQLGPGEEFSASYQVNYWVPFAGIMLLTLGIAAIKLIGNSVSLIKTAENDGDNIKINLEIENTAEKTVEELRLEEFIPDIATVDEKFSMKTPKIRKTNEGTKLTWKIQDLEPGDQRIIQYQIKPKVQVEDKVEFQKAVLKNLDGEKVAESNKASAEFNA